MREVTAALIPIPKTRSVAHQTGRCDAVRFCTPRQSSATRLLYAAIPPCPTGSTQLAAHDLPVFHGWHDARRSYSHATRLNNHRDSALTEVAGSALKRRWRCCSGAGCDAEE